MSEKIVVGPFNRGLRTDRVPFNIDNDSFPTLINAYQWRGRVKRKRGTSLLGRLNRFLMKTDAMGNIDYTLTDLPLQPGVSFFVIGTDVFQDIGDAGPMTTLITNGSATVHTLNRNTGALSIHGSLANTNVFYFPGLPVMGLEELSLPLQSSPGTLAFDTFFSYNIATNSPYNIYDVGFFKNPSTPNTPKTTWTPFHWNGQDYQQFWSFNFQGAFWVTNGIPIPFVSTNIGMQYKTVISVTMITPTSARITFDVTHTPHNLVKGDYLFFNEFPLAVVTGINFQTGFVSSNDPQNVNFVDVTFPNASLAGAGGATTTGIAQYLTNQVGGTTPNSVNGNLGPNYDCIKWYDGDPTGGSPPLPSVDKGFVNFCPPLSQGNFSITGTPAAQYYLVTARMIVSFKDRLMFFGPVIQTSKGIDTTENNSQIYLQDTVIFSQAAGTVYYTASFKNTPDPTKDTPTSSSNIFNPLLVPSNQTAYPPAWFEDATGFGGFESAGLNQKINTVINNEDALLVGFDNRFTRFLYSGNDINPFLFYNVNTEMGSSSVFSGITLDRGGITFGNRGIVLSSQTDASRIDIEIPDQIFQLSLSSNGAERVTAQRDFINEWLYFTYPNNQLGYKYPDQTLFYNYREQSWALFNESYTTYGQFRVNQGNTWSSLTDITWADWSSPWNSGSSTVLQPIVIGGNQQGFVLFREGTDDAGTNEDSSGLISNIAANLVTSPNHNLSVPEIGLNDGTYIIINGALGNVANQVNGRIFKIASPTTNTFQLNPPLTGSYTYLGGATFTKLYIPYIQSKQFPTAWGMSRKTRLGTQMYLLTTTQIGQITLEIFLSQNGDSPYNLGTIVPDNTMQLNSSLIYSTVLYTCPESANLGLTAPNTNLQMVTAANQEQIWHRMNTSLLGDTVQIGLTLSSDQMQTLSAGTDTFTITGATQASPCVLTVANDLSVNQLVMISGVVGMTQLNGNIYLVTAASSTTLSIGVDSSLFGSYMSGGTVTPMGIVIPTSEIELHGMILDVSPSMLLA